MIHLLAWDFLQKYHTKISFSQKREIILEIDSHQSNPSGELNDPLIYLIAFICSKSDSTRADAGNW